MNLREHELLGRHTTLRTGGPARYFVEVAAAGDLLEAWRFSRSHHLPVLVLGGGSNVLVADQGFAGLVIRISTRGLRLQKSPSDAVEIVAEAGEEWDALVAFAVEHNLGGLENMSLIPGTVGAAVIGNIGAYGAEVKDSFLWAEAFDLRTGATRRFQHQECVFDYRGSWFKSQEGRNFVVTRAAFSLNTSGAPDLRYRDLADHFSARRLSSPTLAEVRDAVIAIRRAKLPDLDQVGTAGSFFKNPVIPRATYEALAARYPGLPGHEEQDHRMKVPLGWVLDKVCGLRGMRKGRVGTHPQQALVIINEGGTAAEVSTFADDIARRVMAATGLPIEWEVEKIP